MIKHYQTAIVTAASRGIGPLIAHALAKEGINLVLAARSVLELEQVAADIRCAGQHRRWGSPTGISSLYSRGCRDPHPTQSDWA
jgi:NAD(P)-dependent dehydrogenase (short-subunit alcohol dehydrogenase family)